MSFTIDPESRPATTPRGSGRIFLRGRTYWIGYCPGREFRESSRSTNRADAEQLLELRISQRDQHRIHRQRQQGRGACSSTSPM